MQHGIVALVLFLYAVSGVFSSHFRGGIIMVRPQPGGAPKEVGIQFSFVLSITYTSAIKFIEDRWASFFLLHHIGSHKFIE